MWVKNITDSWEILQSKHSLPQNKYYCNLYEFLKQRIHALVGKLKNRCFCLYSAAILVFLKGTVQHGVSIQSFINLGKPFFPNIAQLKYFTDLILGKGFCIFIFFHFPDSSPSVLNGLHFYFSLRDGASRRIRIVARSKPHMFCEESLAKIEFRAFAKCVGP